MSTNKKLTTEEIAAVYRCSPKTWRKRVVAMKIPHIKLGRAMLFDAGAVELHLSTLVPAEPLENDGRRSARSAKRPRTNRAASSRYRELLGV